MTPRIIRVILFLSKEVKPMTFREVEKLLISNGWKYHSTKGSHHYYIHSELGGKITIPKHRWRCKKGNTQFDIKTSRVEIDPCLTLYKEE